MSQGKGVQRKFERESSISPENAAESAERPPVAGPMSPGAANNEFALALFEKLRGMRGNLFFSPFGVRTAFALVLAGARGDTAAEMREGLRLPNGADEALHAGLAALAARVAAAGGDSAQLTIANALFAQTGRVLEAPFRDIVDRHYRGEFHDADFRSASEAARGAINRWVADRTRGRISNLIPEGGLTSLTRLVVANAVYFKGAWEEPFDPSDTSDEPFFLEGGGKVTAPLMRLDGERVRYTRSAGFDVAELAYRGSGLAMLILLPESQDGLAELEGRLTAKLLRQCVHSLVEREVKVLLPRYEMTWESELGDVLSSLGLGRAFDRSRADFSGINGLTPPNPDALVISRVRHKAFANVSEEGTEAAAATAVEGMCLSGVYLPDRLPIPVFRADHPFLFAIRDRASGTILFLGRMADPTRPGA